MNDSNSSVDCSLDVLYSNLDVGKYANLEKESVLSPLEEESDKFMSTDIGWAQASLSSVTESIESLDMSTVCSTGIGN
jgi:hypothetical protein